MSRPSLELQAQHTIGVAIGLPEPHASELEAHRAAFGDPQAHAIPAHVTLLAPTHVPVGGMPAVREHLAAVGRDAAPFHLHLRGTATFRPVSPVVFVSVVEGISGCERLERAVRSGVLLRRRRFPYHPHVTIAHDLPDEALDTAFDVLSDFDARIEVDRFTLYEQSDDGVWQVLDEFRLEGRPLRESRAVRH